MRRGSLPIALGLALIAGSASAQDPARDRLAREAAGQAAEADKLFKLGKYEEALTLYRAERKSRNELGDTRYEAYAYRGIACCLSRLGEVEEAIEAAKAAKKLDLAAEDKGLAGYDALLIARGFVMAGDDKQAEAEAKFALTRFTQGEDKDHEAETRLLLGLVRLRADRVEEAEKEIERGLGIAEALEIPALLAEAWSASAALDRASGRLGSAYERLSDAQRIYADELNLPESATRLDVEIADLLVDLGNLEAAESRFLSAAEEFSRRDDARAEGEARTAIAGLRLDLRNPKGAVEEVERAVACFRRCGSKPDEISALVVKAQAQELAGDREAAYGSIDAATSLAERVYRDQPEEVVRLALLSAEAAGRLKKKADVDRHLKTAETSATRSGDTELKALVKARAKALSAR